MYLYLSSVPSATIDEICDALKVKKLAAFSILKSLSGQDLITKDDSEYRVTG